MRALMALLCALLCAVMLVGCGGGTSPPSATLRFEQTIHRLERARLAFGRGPQHPDGMDANSHTLHALSALAAISLDDGSQVRRGLFDVAWAAAHDQTGPPLDLVAFREAVWEQLAAAFEWVPLATPPGVDLALGGQPALPANG